MNSFPPEVEVSNLVFLCPVGRNRCHLRSDVIFGCPSKENTSLFCVVLGFRKAFLILLSLL